MNIFRMWRRKRAWRDKTINWHVESGWAKQWEKSRVYVIGIPLNKKITHVFLFAFDRSTKTAIRIESVRSRIDIQVVSCYEGEEWLKLFTALKWPIERVQPKVKSESRWFPWPMTCVEICKRAVGAPWWIVTPNQLLTWARKAGK